MGIITKGKVAAVSVLLTGFGLFGAVGMMTVDKTVSLEYLRRDGVQEILLNHAGSETLDQMYELQRPVNARVSESLQNLQYGLFWVVDMELAIDDACATNQFQSSSVCADYAQVNAGIAAQAKINDRYDWARLAGSYLLGGAIVGAAGMVYLILNSNRNSRKEQLTYQPQV